MSITDNPLDDFIRNECELEDEQEDAPVCSCCDQPITSRWAVYYNDQWVCKECEPEFWEDVRSDFLERTRANG